MFFSVPPDKEYFTIGEVARLTGVKPYVLRYWEKAFGLVRPARRGSGHRRFSRRDVDAVGQIRVLIYDRRMTLEGAKKELRAQARRGPVQVALTFEQSSAAVQLLKDVKRDVADLVQSLKRGPGASPAAV